MSKLIGMALTLILSLIFDISSAACGVGDGCWVFDPCCDGYSCQPGVQECYHHPRWLGEPCSAGFECGPGLQCYPVIHTCALGGPTFSAELVELRNENNQQCLDDILTDGNVMTHGCHGGNNQQWLIEYSIEDMSKREDYYARIISRHEMNKCLDVAYGGSGYNGQNVVTHTCHDRDNQKWRIEGKFGNLRIKSKLSGGTFCLEPNNAGNIVINTCDDSNNNQLWKIDVAPKRRLIMNEILSSNKTQSIPN